MQLHDDEDFLNVPAALFSANPPLDTLSVRPDLSAASPFVQPQFNPPSSQHAEATSPPPQNSCPTTTPSTAAAAAAVAAAAAAGAVSPPANPPDNAPNAKESSKHESRGLLLTERSRGRQAGAITAEGMLAPQRRSGHVRTNSNSSLGSSRSGRSIHRSRTVHLPQEHLLH